MNHFSELEVHLNGPQMNATISSQVSRLGGTISKDGPELTWLACLLPGDFLLKRLSACMIYIRDCLIIYHRPRLSQFTHTAYSHLPGMWFQSPNRRQCRTRLAMLRLCPGHPLPQSPHFRPLPLDTFDTEKGDKSPLNVPGVTKTFSKVRDEPYDPG